MTPIKLFGDSISGNCYKLKLVCAQLGVEYDWHEIDILKGESRTEAYLRMNPNGKVPVLALPDGRYLPESNAILWYLAADSALAGTDRYEQASILSWLCFEQYSHEPFIATSRFIVRYLGSPEDQQASLESKRRGGYRALDVMEQHLGEHEFFANDSYSIADIALFAYTHVADEGGFELTGYPNVNAWLERVRNTDGFVGMYA